MTTTARLRAGYTVLRRHLRYAGRDPRKLLWVARRALALARAGALSGVLERHAAEADLYADYAEWCRRHEPDAAGFAARVAALPRQPLFSVLLPVFDPPPALLEATIASVRAQAYPNWELCVVDDASTAAGVRECLARAAAQDPRIRLARRADNGGIARATNDALAAARGEFCAFLDHDDTIAPDALLCMAEAIAARPDAQALFCDEDKLDEQGARTRPFFKPAWDAEWIRTTNCVLHFLVARTDALRALGGLAEGVDGAQDWDLVLRLEEAAGRAAHRARAARALPLAGAARLHGGGRVREAEAGRGAARRARGVARAARRAGDVRADGRRLAHRLGAARAAAARVDRDPDARPPRAAARVHRLDPRADDVRGLRDRAGRQRLGRARGARVPGPARARRRSARDPLRAAVQLRGAVQPGREGGERDDDRARQQRHRGRDPALARRTRGPRRAPGRGPRGRDALVSGRHAAARGRDPRPERRRRPAVDRHAARLRGALRPRARRARGERDDHRVRGRRARPLLRGRRHGRDARRVLQRPRPVPQALARRLPPRDHAARGTDAPRVRVARLRRRPGERARERGGGGPLRGALAARTRCGSAVQPESLRCAAPPTGWHGRRGPARRRDAGALSRVAARAVRRGDGPRQPALAVRAARDLGPLPRLAARLRLGRS